MASSTSVSTLQYYLQSAKHAVSYVNRKIRFSSNDPIDVTCTLGLIGIGMQIFRKVADAKATDVAKASGGKSALSDYMRGSAEMAEVARIGNCREKAALAFLTLEKAGVKPLDLMAWLPPADHAFVVIGREPGDPSDYRNWGKNAVVCDAWDKTSYAAVEIPAKMADGYTGPFVSLTRTK